MPIKDALKELREKVFARVDWDASPSVEAVNDIDSFINDAVERVCLDAPFLFYEGRVRFYTQSDVSSVSSADTLVTSTDIWGNNASVVNPYVLRTSLDATNNSTATATWSRDGSWDGRRIDIIGTDLVPRQNRIRTIWQGWIDQVGPTLYNFVALEKPIARDFYGTGPFTYRIYTDDYHLPDDVIEVKSMRVVGSDYNEEIEILNQTEAERAGVVDMDSTSGTGQPRTAWRSGYYQLSPPNVSPTAVLGSGGAGERWLGPEPFGKFEYCFTYVYGKRDVDTILEGSGRILDDGSTRLTPEPTVQTGFGALGQDDWFQLRRMQPKFESSPSPVSGQVTTNKAEAGGTGHAPSIKLTFPNRAYMMGFGGVYKNNTNDDFRINAWRDGVHIRIYRRRLTEDYTNYTDLGTTNAGFSVPSLLKLDIHDAFYLLSEFRIDDDNSGIYHDYGDIIPDYSKRLRNIHGYQGVRLHPQPNARHEIEARVVLRPRRLYSDNDAPELKPEASELIVAFARVLTYEKLKEPDARKDAFADYQRELMAVKKRYGMLKPTSMPGRIRPARMRSYGSLNRWQRRNS